MTRPPAGAPDADGQLAAAGVVHDVNQMLTVITGRVEVLRRRGSLRPGDLDAIALAARDAAAILRRLDGGGGAVDDSVAELARCLGEVVLVHRPPGGEWSPPAGGWVLAIDAPPDLAVAAPAQVVREVMGNLVANAVEAMSGPRTGPAGARLEIVARREGGRVRIIVRDSGPGLAPGDRERIFAAGWSTRGGAGRGLGLAASRQLLGRWGGRLDAGEPDGGGAVFVLDLPAAALPAAPVPPAAAEAGTLAGPVLVVDDERAVREVLVEVLGARGIAVTAVGDAAAAREACRTARFAVALVDLHLPGEPGTGLAQWLRAGDDAPAVVLMTGVGRGDRLATDAAACSDAVVTKPLDFAGLPALLAAVAARRGRGGGQAEGSGRS